MNEYSFARIMFTIAAVGSLIFGRADTAAVNALFVIAMYLAEIRDAIKDANS